MMKRKQASTMFLRLVVMIIGLLIMAMCVFLVPWLAKEAFTRYPMHWVVLVMVCLYLAALPFYVALAETWKLLYVIDSNQAFSNLSVVALKRIMLCAICICVLHTAILPILYLIAQFEDAPGLIILGMVIPGASMVIAVFAAVLRTLLDEALAIKSDNDLTI